MLEIYSYIFYSLNSKNTNIFDRSKLIDSFVFSLIWGDLHPIKLKFCLYLECL